MRRLLVPLLALLLLSGCSPMNLADYAGSRPAFAPERYFLGETRAWGFFADRFGTVRREFTVAIEGRLEDGVLTLDEDFVYADGERQQRVWTIRKGPDGSYEGSAGDIVGTARGRAAGRAMNWIYDLLLPVGDTHWQVRFDDWMLLQDERVMLNRTSVSKLGVEIGTVVIFFVKENGSGGEGEAPAHPAKHPAQ